MNRSLSIAVIARTALAGAVSTTSKTHNTTSPTIEVESLIIDTIAARQEMVKSDSIRKHWVSVYRRMHNGLKTLPEKWGKEGLSRNELTALDSLIAYPATRALPSYSKIVKDREKGKAHKDLAATFDEFINYCDSRMEAWMGTFYNPSTAPRVKKARLLNNPFYLPAIINKPAMMDSTDYDSQVLNWAWTDTDKWTKREETYPKPFNYREYASHPELRVIGSMIFDKQGNLIAIKRLPRTGRQLRQKDGLLYPQMIDSLLQRDYLNNVDNIQSEEDPVNPVLRARLGIDDNPELASEPNKRAQAWINQLTRKHQAELARIYKVERFDDQRFFLTMLDDQGNSTYRIFVEAKQSGPYDAVYNVLGIEQAEPVSVDMNFKPDTKSSDAALLPFYMIPEEPATMPGGDEALTQFMLNNMKLPVGALPDDFDHPVTLALEVDKTGKVQNVWVIRTSGTTLDAVASTAAGNIRSMLPGKVNMQPVNSMRYITVVFNKTGMTIK